MITNVLPLKYPPLYAHITKIGLFMLVKSLLKIYMQQQKVHKTNPITQHKSFEMHLLFNSHIFASHVARQL